MQTVYMIKIKSKKDTKFYRKNEEGWLGLGGFHSEQNKDTAFKCKTMQQAEYNVAQTKVWNKNEWEVLGIIPVAI